MLTVVVVKIFLQIIVAQSVSFFMSSVPITFHLQTLVSQVNERVLRFKVVFGRTRSQVPVLVKVDSVVFCHNGPNTDVKLSAVEEKGVLDILLNDPRFCLWVLLINELLHVTQVTE